MTRGPKINHEVRDVSHGEGSRRRRGADPSDLGVRYGGHGSVSRRVRGFGPQWVPYRVTGSTTQDSDYIVYRRSPVGPMGFVLVQGVGGDGD